MAEFQDPNNLGPDVARNMPGVGSLINVWQALKSAGEKAPGNFADVLKLLGLSTQQQPTYRNDQPLPRYGGTDDNGQPKIIQPQTRFYPQE